MSARSLRLVAVYLVLVGVPAAGLVWVLSIGSSVVAPPAIDGEWEIADDEVARCFGVERLTIDQSGRFLRVHAGAEASDGRLDGERVAARLHAPSGACAGAVVALEGRVDGSTLEGALIADGCDTCDRRPVRATRVTTEED